MKILDDGKFAAWALKRDVATAGRKLSLQTSIAAFIALETPLSAEGQMNLAGDLLAMGGFDVGGEEGLWITLWDVWND